MRALAVAAVLLCACVALTAAAAGHRGDVHSTVLRHINALPMYHAMAARKVEETRQNGQRHLLLQTCARMTEERDGELAQLKDFVDIFPAACAKYVESHGLKIMDLHTCPNATQDSGSITGLGDGACCDKDDQCTSGTCDRSTRTCTMTCNIEAAIDSCASHQGGWNDESFCELISLDPTPPADCTYCHMSYDCGNLGSIDNICMECPTYVGEVTNDILATANCLEENTVDDFHYTQNDDSTIFDGDDCVATVDWQTQLRCDHGYLTECAFPTMENINILLGPDCLDFPCGLIDTDYLRSEYDFECAGNGNGTYCSAIMKCALSASDNDEVDDCAFGVEAGCCPNTWVTYYEANNNASLVSRLLDLESMCNLDNSSICEPCYGEDCEEYIEPVVDDYQYDFDTSADDIKPYAATLIALFCIVFVAILVVLVAVSKGLCPCCGGGGGKPRQQQQRAASPKPTAGGEGTSSTQFTAVAASEPVAAPPASGAVVPQYEETNTPAAAV